VGKHAFAQTTMEMPMQRFLALAGLLALLVPFQAFAAAKAQPCGFLCQSGKEVIDQTAWVKFFWPNSGVVAQASYPNGTYRGNR
jgi:hypothetical protein